MEKVHCKSGLETAHADHSKSQAVDIHVHQVFHMNGGEGENSYAKNSSFQKKVILEAKRILQESIVELYCNSFPECLKLADLGCSSGPNTFLTVWEILEALETTCGHLNHKPPILQVFLNDLPGNDFNTIFRSLLPSFYERLNKEKGDEFGQCFIAAVPGSFYGRLFPSHSLHFVHSSYSLHWLSQVPKGLEDALGTPLNKGNIYVTKTSPPSVHKAYLDQFKRDFTTFLRLRSEELVPAGRMVFALVGREDNVDSSNKYGPNIWELLGMKLNDMVSEGLIGEQKLDSFNWPHYAPSPEEVKRVIQTEGSFDIFRLETFELSWVAGIDDGNKGLVFNKYAKGKYVANRIRTVAESILATHFGDAIIDDLFQRYALKAADLVEVEKGMLTNLVISLTKK